MRPERHRARRVALVAGMAAALGAALLGTACARRSGPPRITLGAPCALCGMPIRDLRFACASVEPRAARIYDSIECLLRDDARPAKARAYLTDYDRAALHPAESLWVVKGSFPTPMGGGLAAFLRRASADEVASATAGRVDRLARFAEPSAAPDAAGGGR